MAQFFLDGIYGIDRNFATESTEKTRKLEGIGVFFDILKIKMTMQKNKNVERIAASPANRILACGRLPKTA